ncbi:hypothetical protein OF83DRAFT_1173513 [Amylostereum chailletii]|nr:hypothetical protein OF83DRAFT_1173513 [Amylostereum chailletii]
MTVKWKSPATIAAQDRSLVLIEHILAGIYLWEFLAHVDYDWRLIRKQKKLSTPAVYLACRLSGLLGLFAIISGFDPASEINCQVWIVFAYGIPDLAMYLSSVLIAIRVGGEIAIWRMNRYVIAIVVPVMIGYFGAFVHSVVSERSTWVRSSASCLITKSEENTPSAVMALCVDILLFSIMLAGLLRWGEGRGLAWIFLATIAEVPPVVFVSLRLNTPMNIIFFTPEMTILLIGSTRMYRSLSDFLSPSSIVVVSSASFSGNWHLRRDPLVGRGGEDNGVDMPPLGVPLRKNARVTT